MSVSAIGGIALALVSVQLVATACLQGRRAHRLNMLDLLGILPGWTFFVQPAGEYDVAIELRRHTSGIAGAWRETVSAVPRRPWHWLWYPEALADGPLWLAIEGLDRRSTAGHDSDAHSSFAYATILAFVRAQPPAGPADGVQFALVRITGTARTRRFLSAVEPC